ncbi:MAG: TIGR00303 family protein [Leptolyngbyaceae cyanobacterium bins.302]|nr:TIGR00303 family protein [Leptolyngbyaceae cyanobacterium bins.302]
MAFIQTYTQPQHAQAWLERYQGKRPLFACVLGFTETGLVPGISAAGATPDSRRYTAIADAEFLVNGVQPQPQYPLPPLEMGASPVFITRAVIETLHLPLCVFNAGLPKPPAVAAIDLKGMPARCLSTGAAMDLSVTQHLFQQGLAWGEKLAQESDGYVILAECVVGGTTTALAALTALGIAAQGKVNSSHPTCNHAQKWQLVQQGLRQWRTLQAPSCELTHPLDIVAAVGDPMQVVVAGMAIAASRKGGVLLAGGTQMLAVYALADALATRDRLNWNPSQIVVGTTRWVAEDPTGDTVGLATLINAPLMATQLSFALSRFSQLRAYEQGFVKEGVGAGGCAIAAHLDQAWGNTELLGAIETLVERYQQIHNGGASEVEIASNPEQNPPKETEK